VGKGTTLVYCDRTDIGRRRSNNQDSMAVLPPSSPQQFRVRGWLFLVADGMGALAAGEMASAIAAERVPLIYEKNAPASPPLALRRSFKQSNGEIHGKGESAAEFKGMGTTCTALAILPRGALVGHVGDSRVYRIRGRTIDQLSRDHSLVWELENAGTVSREQAGSVPKNIITRSMGPHADVEVDLEGPFGVEDGDVFLLCSDGLSGQVADEEIGGFAAALEPRDAAAALVGLALVRGAPDNVTVIVARAGPEEASKVAPGDEPWPMSEGDPVPRQPQAYPWGMLLVSAGALLIALVINPWSKLMEAACVASDLVRAACLAGTVLAALVFMASLLWSVLGFLVPESARARVLAPGSRLGRGPYRSYDCAPTKRLLEGIVASVESAADGLPEAGRNRMIARLTDVQRHVAAAEYPEALAAVAEAIGIYARSVEASRSDDTAHGGDQTVPHRSA
jgi:protein phosphatase